MYDPILIETQENEMSLYDIETMKELDSQAYYAWLEQTEIETEQEGE